MNRRNWNTKSVQESMERVPMELPGGMYEILIGQDVSSAMGSMFRNCPPGSKICIITDPVVDEIAGSGARDIIRSAGLEPAICILDGEGEDQKSFSSVEKIGDFLSVKGFDRGDYVLALGGGVVGDIAGFAASCYMRGISYFQHPTTLLAMIDSAIGGKTGVNLASGKNLMGAFYQPEAVFISTVHLTTLPVREWYSGFGEMMKYGALRSGALLERIVNFMSGFTRTKSESGITRLIQECVKIKVEVVVSDVRESDRRRILNLGHTFGHALEALTGYSRYTHGEAVLFGLTAAAALSHNMGLLGKEEYRFLAEHCSRFPDIPPVPEIVPDAFVQAMLTDKKVRNGRIYFILLEGIGNPVIRCDIPGKLIEKSVEEATELWNRKR